MTIFYYFYCALVLIGVSVVFNECLKALATI
jgi:hypothetical protein